MSPTTQTPHEIATLIRHAALSFADMSLLVSAIENRLVHAGAVQNVATEDASVRLCQAIDEMGQLRDRTPEEVRAHQLSYLTEMLNEARREAA